MPSSRAGDGGDGQERRDYEDRGRGGRGVKVRDGLPLDVLLHHGQQVPRRKRASPGGCSELSTLSVCCLVFRLIDCDA